MIAFSRTQPPRPTHDSARKLFARWAGLALALLWLASAPAEAQSGGIRVQIVDAESGSPLPGATVTVSNTRSLVADSSTITDKDGWAEFPILRVGTGYEIEASMPGFGSQRQPQIRVRSAQTEVIRLALSLPLQERVQVTGGRGVVDLDQVGSNSKFSDEFIEDLPAPGRFYQDILTLAPGVNDEDGDGNPNVHGARSRDFRAEVSGVSNTDPLTGQWLSYINADSIEELEVIPLAAGVEFGRAQGGFARILQKQGSNEFEGVVNFLYRSSQFDGDGASNLPASQTPEFESLQPGFQVSGAIVKDKLWYRLSHDYVKRQDPINVLNRIEVTTLTQRISADQITWQVSPRNKLAFQYQYDPLTLENFGVSSTVPSESTQVWESGGPTLSLSWTAPYSAKLLSETTLAYQDHSQDLTPTTSGVEQDCVSFFYFDALDLSRCQNLATNRTSGSHHETSNDQRQRFTLKSQLTFFGRLAGQSHQLKIGFVSENERYFRDLTRNSSITFSVVGNALSSNGLASLRVSVPPTSRARATANSWAVYAEDQWKPAGGLVLTAGLRVDIEEIDALGRTPIDALAEGDSFIEQLTAGGVVSTINRETFTAYEDIQGFQQGLAEIIDTHPSNVRFDAVASQSSFWNRKRLEEDITIENTNVSPRISLAWDPWNNGKTKLAASFGRYYDKIFLAVPLVELEPVESTINFGAIISDGSYTNFDQITNISTLSAKSVDRNLRTPYQDEITFSVERALWPETVLRATYVKRNFEDQLQDTDINHLPGDKGRCVIPAALGDPVIEISEGDGHQVEDPYTGDVYTDTDPGLGDGRIDDCTGDVSQLGAGPSGFLLDTPDGRPDLYVQNPGWRELLLIGNFNTSEYEAFVLELIRRQFRSWEMQASYTWSEAIGDAEDFNLLLGNEATLRDDERGFLSYDQRHIVKLNVTSITPWGFRLGGVVRWESGLPFSSVQSKLSVFSTPPFYLSQGARGLRTRLRYPSGQRNDLRNPQFWTFDMRIAKDFSFGRAVQMQLSAEVFNLLNDNTLRLTERTSGANVGERRFGRRWQFGFRLQF